MKHRAAIVKELADQLRPLGMVALAVAFEGADDTEHLMAIGSMDRLASMSAGILDKTQDNMFTSMQYRAGRYDTLIRDAYSSPAASMSISICVDGEWKRLATADDLNAVLAL